MRLTSAQIQAIRHLTSELAGPGVQVRVFGSRLDDSARGGDVDLLIDSDKPVGTPALLASRIAARLSRTMGGRKVDVVIRAPNLSETPVHRIALEQGVLL